MALHGESTFLDLRSAEAFFVTSDHRRIPGSFRCTNYMVYFHPDKGATPPHFRHIPLSFFRIPLGLIERLTVPDKKKRSSRSKAKAMAKAGSHHVICVHCRDVRILHFGFATAQTQQQVLGLLKVLAFPARVNDVFAFSHMNKSQSNAATGWEVYDLKGEFIRQGVFNVQLNSRNTWREFNLNNTYEFCTTYPNVLVVPAQMSDTQMRRVAGFRSRERIPAFTWMHPGNHTTLWRSSQPMVGVGGNSCREDEEMLTKIRRGSVVSAAKPFLIADCRPMLNAMGNKAAGKGWETYKNTSIEFFGIHSIHVMRDSFNKLKSLCLNNSSLASPFKDAEFSSAVEDTGWLKHVRTVILGGLRIATAMHRQGLSVLCHCSDGWDRTAQCVCMAQLFMDPYFRTLRGFCGLIAKDWLAFGHQFQHRVGHADAKYDDSQRSPVFLQFLDCVWQLVDQFPTVFEFTPRLLLFLAHHLFSCRFGDFLFDCERQRVDAALATCTPCIWGYVLQNRKQYTNPSYNPDTPPVFLPAPSVVARNVKLWAPYYLRFSPVASCLPKNPPFEDYTHAAGSSAVSVLQAREGSITTPRLGMASVRVGAGAGAGAGAATSTPRSVASTSSSGHAGNPPPVPTSRVAALDLSAPVPPVPPAAAVAAAATVTPPAPPVSAPAPAPAGPVLLSVSADLEDPLGAMEGSNGTAESAESVTTPTTEAVGPEEVALSPSPEQNDADPAATGEPADVSTATSNDEGAADNPFVVEGSIFD